MKPRIGLFLGDPSGIGPEIVVKLLSRPEEYSAANVVVIGERWAFEGAQRIVGVKIELPTIASPDQLAAASLAFLETNFLQQHELVRACATAQAGAAVIKSLKIAIDLAKKGRIDAICYAPLNKQAMHLAGLQVPRRVEVLCA